MKVLFHVLTYFSQGGVTEDAFSLFRSLSRMQNVTLDTLVVERIEDTGIYHKEVELNASKPTAFHHIKVRLITLVKFIARCLVPRKYRKSIKIRLKQLLEWSRTPQAITEPARADQEAESLPMLPVTRLNLMDSRTYLKRFEGSVDPAHLDLLREERCFYADKFIDAQGLPIDIEGWDFLFLPFFIDPSNFAPQSSYLMRLHDICFIKGATYQRSVDFQRLKEMLDGAVAHEKILFICNSPYSQSELEAYAPQTKGRTYVVPCQVPKQNEVKGDKAQLRQLLIDNLSYRHLRPFNMPKVKERIDKLNDYILVVGGEHARKNYEILLEGWQMHQKKHPQEALPIVWVGYECSEYMGTFIDDAKPLINKGKIIHVEKVSRQVLNQLFMHASLFIVASHDEGFSIPPVEAQQFGCPVVASNIAVHQWVLGEGAAFFDTTNAKQLCDKLSELTGDNSEALKGRLRSLGIENAKRFYPENVDKDLANVLREIENKYVKRDHTADSQAAKTQLASSAT